MPVTINNTTYTNNNSGRTRVNEQGLIVGVDFSSTSNTIATGSKTFTLTADANVNRDWPVGSSLVAVAQAGATGSMIGTVTSYDPATQVLVMNVASITGSGTSTDWRIGSTMLRELTPTYDFRTYNPLSLQPASLVEGGGTNLVFPSATATTQTRTVISGETYALSFYGTGTVTLTGAATGAAVGTGAFPAAITSRIFVATTASLTLTVTGTVNDWQLELGSVATSRIPTTTVAVSRAADQLSVGGTNFSQFYNSAQGTLVFEATPIASAVGAVLGSLNDGTLNNAIRIGQKQSGTLSSIRKMATDGVTDLFAVNAATGNTVRSNGVDYIETPDQSGVAKFGMASSGVGNFLSVGNSENFRNTTDSGLTYTERALGAGTFNGAHFGIGRFVIAHSTSRINGANVGSVIVSTDGLAFRRVNIPGLTQPLNEIASNGTNQYVAVGNAGVIYTSPDAETWTAQTSGTANNLDGAAFFSGRYVAVSSTANQSKYSDNGTSWTAVTGLATGMTDIAHNGTSMWIAVGAGGAIYSSADGVSYTTRTSNTTQALLGVHFADGLWVAVGAAGTVVTSPDGTTWTNRTANSGTTQTLTEVNFFNGKFYYVGASQVIGENTAANIAANVTWTARTTNVSATLNGIATNGSRLLICGTSGAITTSEDGTTFTSRTGNNATLNGAAFGNGTYVVVGNAVNGSGLIATVNPTTFEYQRRVSGVTGNLQGLRFLNGIFFYVGASANSIGNSSDGIVWVNRLSGQSFFDIAFGNGTYVAVGNAGTRSVSGDGNTFNNGATVATVSTLNGIDFANGLFVAVGVAGTIITSPNGTTWTLRTSGTTATLYSVMYSTRDNQWYAAGDGGVILRSADAITWTSIANDATVGIFTAGALQANPLAGKFIPNVKNRVAIGWDTVGGVAISINGADAVIDPSVTMPILTQYSIGMNGVAGQHWNSTIKTQRAYRVRVSNDELKALSRV